MKSDKEKFVELIDSFGIKENVFCYSNDKCDEVSIWSYSGHTFFIFDKEGKYESNHIDCSQ